MTEKLRNKSYYRENNFFEENSSTLEIILKKGIKLGEKNNTQLFLLENNLFIIYSDNTFKTTDYNHIQDYVSDLNKAIAILDFNGFDFKNTFPYLNIKDDFLFNFLLTKYKNSLNPKEEVINFLVKILTFLTFINKKDLMLEYENKYKVFLYYNNIVSENIINELADIFDQASDKGITYKDFVIIAMTNLIAAIGDDLHEDTLKFKIDNHIAIEIINYNNYN